MRCAECGGDKDPSARGWVTVLAPSDALRVHYCPDCMAELVRVESPTAEDTDDD